MKIDLNKAVVNLDGVEIPNSNLGKILAQLLANSNKGDALKFWETALKLQKGEEIDLDTSDQSTIKEFVKSTDQVTNIVKAQILLSFEKK
jgi:hypothetical protein